MSNKSTLHFSNVGASFLLLSIVTACAAANSDTLDMGTAGATNAAASGKSGGSIGGATSGGQGGTGVPSSSTDTSAATHQAVDLRTAGNYVILAESGISTVPTSVITGSLGISPAAATFITGFALSADPTKAFSTSLQVTGNLYAADYTPPTPSNLTAAVSDMQLAFSDAAGRAPDSSELGAGNIGGMTLTPGVYKWSTGLLIPTAVTLHGSATAVWIFQIAQNLSMSSGAKIVLAGGALPKNVFWQVSGLVELGTTAHGEGIVLAQTSISMGTGASINGRLLAQTAVSIDSSTVVAPAN